MALLTTELTRLFRYNSVELPDPGPQYSADEVRELYSATYPEIVNAAIEGPDEKEGKLVYTFRRAVGTKGSEQIRKRFAKAALNPQELEHYFDFDFLVELAHCSGQLSLEESEKFRAAVRAWVESADMEVVVRQDLAELMPLAELQIKLSHIFPSISSLEWHLRQNRSAYMEAGAIFEIAGRLLAHPTTFKRVALEIGTRLRRVKRNCA